MMKLIPSTDNICSKYAEKMLIIKINNHCNCSCPFCVDKGGFSAKETNISEIVKNAIELAEYQYVYITGGEPFLDFKLLIELLSKLRPHKRHIGINTNGTLITPARINALNGLINELQISIHHWLESVNKQILGKKQDLTIIKESLNHNCNFAVSINSTFNSFTPSRERLIFIDKMTEVCKYIGANKLRITELKRVDSCDFVSARDFFEPSSYEVSRNSNELITQGCTVSFKRNDIDVYMKRLCAYAKDKNAPAFSCCFINEQGQKVIDVDTENTFRIIYSNGIVRKSWIYKT